MAASPASCPPVRRPFFDLADEHYTAGLSPGLLRQLRFYGLKLVPALINQGL